MNLYQGGYTQRHRRKANKSERFAKFEQRGVTKIEEPLEFVFVYERFFQNVFIYAYVSSLGLEYNEVKKKNTHTHTHTQYQINIAVE